MGIQVNIHEAKTRLSQLVAASERGEEVILARAGKPVVRMVPIERDRDAIRAERLAWIGSVPRSANPDVLLEPNFTQEELEKMYSPSFDPCC